MEETTTVSTKFSRSQLKEIEELARKKGIDRSVAIKRLITEGLKAERKREAVELVRMNRVTIWQAAELAQVSYREMLQLLRNSNVPFPLTPEELKKELGEILESSK